MYYIFALTALVVFIGRVEAAPEPKPQVPPPIVIVLSPTQSEAVSPH